MIIESPISIQHSETTKTTKINSKKTKSII